MYIPNLQVLSFPLYSFLSHWQIFHPKDSPSLCPLDLIFHLFRNLILLILSHVLYLQFLSLSWVFSFHNFLKTSKPTFTLFHCEFNLPPLHKQTSYFYFLTSHLVFFNLQSGFYSIMPPDWLFTNVPNDVFMSLNPNVIFITHLTSLWKAAFKAD